MELRLDVTQSIPDDWTVIDSVAVMKCMDADGVVHLAIRMSDTMTPWEALGMVDTACHMTRKAVQSMFVEKEEEE